MRDSDMVLLDNKVMALCLDDDLFSLKKVGEGEGEDEH